MPPITNIIVEQLMKKIKWKISGIALKRIVKVVGVILLLIFISIGPVSKFGKQLNLTVFYEEYPIEKLTTYDTVYFNGTSQSLAEGYVILEEPNDEYENVVIVKKEQYYLQWLYKIKCSSTTFHVYLSEDVYKLYKQFDDKIIYEAKK